MNYEVYIGRLDGVVVYIGEGKLGRHKHLNSGLSHVYEANRAHFEHKTIEIEIVGLFPSKECVRKKESELITYYKPLWNRNTGCSSRLKTEISESLRYAKRTRNRAYHVLKILEPWLCESDTYKITRKMREQAGLPHSSLKMSVLMGDVENGRGAISKMLSSMYKIEGSADYQITFSEDFMKEPRRFIKSNFR